MLFKNNKLKLRVVAWNSNEIKLNSIILKNETDRRNFRVRCSSQFILSYMDELYFIEHTTEERNQMVRNIQKKNASNKNIQYWNNLSSTEKYIKQQHMRKIQKLVDHSKINYSIPWNKNKTKETDERLMLLSKQRSGNGNPMFGTKMSEQEKIKKSKLIKKRIETGQWTPHIHNSKTHWDCIYNNQKYRSSWEAMYASLNPTDKYETIRIPYFFEGKMFIYMVDFVNEQKRILTEIKPIEKINDKKFQAKKCATDQWCVLNNYTFKILTQQYFIENFNKINFDDLTIPNLRQKLAKLKYEANKNETN